MILDNPWIWCDDVFVLVMVSGPGYSSGDPGHGRTLGYHSDTGLLSPGSPLEASPASWVDIPPVNGQNTSLIQKNGHNC